MIDVLMATLGEYDALWDGVLFPEIIDAEYSDNFDKSVGIQVNMPSKLFLRYDIEINEEIDRLEAMATLLATVSELSQQYPKELYSEGIDAILTDCSTLEEYQILDPRITKLPE